MRLPKWLHQFSYQREPIWILVFALTSPLVGLVVVTVSAVGLALVRRFQNRAD